MMTSKELRAQRFKLVEDARAVLNEGGAENNAKFDMMMAEADTLMATITKMERADEAIAASMEDQRNRAMRQGVPVGEIEGADKLEADTFSAWVRRGPGGLNQDQMAVYQRRFQAAQSEGSDTAGGYTVPTDNSFMTKIEDAQKAYGGMLEACFTFDTTGAQPLPIPTDNDTTNTGAILGENVQVGTQDISFGSVTFNGYTYTSKLVLVSNQLLQDTAFGLDAFLSGKLGTRLARIVNTHTTTGTGASQPTGVVTAATLGFTAGNATGGTSTATGATATIAYDDLVELEHSVDPAYRRNGKFMMADASLKVIKKMKDGIGRPLWVAGLAVKEPDTINGYSYSINQDMATPAASAKTVLFGDFSKYYIRRIVGLQMLRLTERYADYNQVGFLAFQRWDGNLVDAGTHPIKYLQQAAS